MSPRTAHRSRAAPPPPQKAATKATDWIVADLQTATITTIAKSGGS
ncbi:MAG: hypothetical protein O3A92_14625 [Verrucomicrobia bacterium]|nr:hypothetical protein [Verrucomicrobiota bacterium]